MFDKSIWFLLITSVKKLNENFLGVSFKFLAKYSIFLMIFVSLEKWNILWWEASNKDQVSCEERDDDESKYESISHHKDDVICKV